MDSTAFDLVIIGAGPGGYVAAIRAAQLGMRTALIERHSALGGTCLNVGCIPSKSLLESSEMLATASHAFAGHGIGIGKVTLDLQQMMERKQAVVKELTDGVAMLMKRNKVKVLTGRGSLRGPGKVTVAGEQGEEELACERLLLAMGSLPVELPFLPFDGDRIVSSTEALAFSEVPGHLLVVGAGAVGLEIGSVWHRLGAKVTVVEMLPTITPFADTAMARALQRALVNQGLELRLKTTVTGAEVGDKDVLVTIKSDGGEEETLTVDRVLVAVGRRPCTEGSGLEDAGVTLDDAGRVAVDDSFQTNLPGVYAIGDLIRGPMLAHKAEEEGIAVAELMAGRAGHVRYETIPNVVYTQPELAMVGRTEAELKEAGVPYTSGRFLFGANGRARSLGQTEGMVKILAHKQTDSILGVHMVGPRVSELIHEAVVAIELSGSAEDLARTCHAHPTLSETVREAALAVDRRAIHG
jgi:dihydrolipoamide dehydrogenase